MMGTQQIHARLRRDQEAFCDVASKLSSPVRLELLSRLAHAPHTVGELCSALGLEQALVSHHLAKLRDAALVTYERRGKQRAYRLASGVQTETYQGRTVVVIRVLLGEYRFTTGAGAPADWVLRDREPSPRRALPATGCPGA